MIYIHIYIYIYIFIYIYICIYMCMCVYVRTSLSNGKFYIDLHIEGTDTSSYTDDIKKL